MAGKVKDASPLWIYVNDHVVNTDAQLTFTDQVAYLDGRQIVTVRAIDAAGNVTVREITVVVDTTPPNSFTVIADPPGWTYNTEPVLTFGATDEISGISHYELSIDGAKGWIVVSPYKLPTQSDGEHTITVQATDKAGWSTVVTTKVYIDTSPPDVPGNLRVIPGNGRMVVKWDASSEDVVSYRIARQGEEKYVTVRGTEYVDQGLKNGQTYAYRVWAVDRANNLSLPTDWKDGMVGMAKEPYIPDEGAIIEYDGVTLVLPMMGLPEGITQIRITEIQSETLEEACIYPVIGPIYEFSAYRAGSVEPEENLACEKGYIGSIYYDENLIPEGFPEQNLAVFHFDPMFGRWFMIPSAGVDVENNVIYFATNHFSSFSVQATVVQDISPQEYKDVGYSPLKSYSEHGEITVSPAGGTAGTVVTELILPGHNGFDFILARRYSTVTAREDAFALAVNGNIGFNLFSPSGDLLEYDDIIKNANKVSKEKWENQFFSEQILQTLKKHFWNQGDYAYSLGQGWRLNIPYIRSANSSLMLCMVDGSMYSINEMKLVEVPFLTTMMRTLKFEQHESDDFTLFVHQGKGIDVLSLKTGDQFVKTMWYGLGYTLVLKDGTTYEMDALGRTTSIVDPTGLNKILLDYRGFQLNYVQDSVGRKIRFEYDLNPLWPRIKRVWLENDPYNRELTYEKNMLGLLVKAKDAGGRVSTYDYGFTLLFGGQIGVRINFMDMLIKLVAGPVFGTVSSIFGMNDIELYGNLQAQFVFPLHEMTAPGQGATVLSYKVQDYVYGGAELETILGIPVTLVLSLTMEQRLMTKNVWVYLDKQRPALQTKNWTYEIKTYGLPILGKSYVARTIEDDGKKKTVYEFTPTEKWRFRWEDKSVKLGKYPIQEAFPSVVLRKDILPLNTIIEVRDVESNTLLQKQEIEYNVEKMRPSKNTTWLGNSVRSIEYKYDTWGNVIYSRDYSEANGRKNELKNWAYYVNVDTTVPAGTPWKNSPYTQGIVKAERKNLIGGTITANYIPTETGDSSVKYLHNYFEYNYRGQKTGAAQWNGSEWLNTQFAYSPIDGSLIEKINVEGHHTIYEYDEHGFLNNIKEKDVKNAQNEVRDISTSFGYEYYSGWKVWEKDPRGYVTEYKYDKLGRTIKMVEPDNDDNTEWVPSGSNPPYRENNPIITIVYDDQTFNSVPDGEKGDV